MGKTGQPDRQPSRQGRGGDGRGREGERLLHSSQVRFEQNNAFWLLLLLLLLLLGCWVVAPGPLKARPFTIRTSGENTERFPVLFAVLSAGLVFPS